MHSIIYTVICGLKLAVKFVLYAVTQSEYATVTEVWTLVSGTGSGAWWCLNLGNKSVPDTFLQSEGCLDANVAVFLYLVEQRNKNVKKK